MNMENLLVLSMDNQEEIREWYISYLCYTQDWQALLTLLDDKNFNQDILATYIAENLQHDFILLYNNDFISDLINYLPLPGSQGSQKLANLLWQTDEEYTADYRKLSEYYKQKERRISRFIYKTSGLSGEIHR